MASILKRKSKYSVVYYYTDSKGERRQRWETCDSHKEALKRKAEIEYTLNEGTFIPPDELTVREFLTDFVSLYGEKQWGVSSYDSNTSLINNYINPIIGDEIVQNITPRFVDKFYKELEKTAAVSANRHKNNTEFVTQKTIGKIHKLLACAFRQAVRWEIIAKNPFEFAMAPKTSYEKRDIWTSDMIRKALDNCRDSKLYIAMNLAFACSLRVGEVLGLTWDNVHIPVNYTEAGRLLGRFEIRNTIAVYLFLHEALGNLYFNFNNSIWFNSSAFSSGTCGSVGFVCL
jgi:integrase